MRNLILFTLDITITGGIERVISNMAQYYANHKDYKVQIWSLFRKNKVPFYEIPKNVDIIYFSNKEYNLTNVLKKIKSHIWILKSFIKIQIPPNSIVISTTTNISIYLSLFNKKKRGISIVGAEHGYYFAYGFFTNLLRKKTYPKLDLIVTLTESEKNNYYFMDGRVISIPNSLSYYPEQSADIRNKRVISAGRLVVEKGYDKLIGIYKSVAEKYPDWDFVIFGDGYLKPFIERQLVGAPCNVKLLPPTNKLKEEMANSSIYACTSQTEAFPMVMLEALASGLSVISFDCPPGPREIIRDGCDGVLVPLNDCQIFIDKLETLIENEELRVSLSQHARNNIKRFLPEEVFKKWDKVLLQL